MQTGQMGGTLLLMRKMMGFTPKRSMVDTSYTGTQILSSSIMQLPVQLPDCGTPACSLAHADAPRQHSEHDWVVTCIEHQGWRQRPAPLCCSPPVRTGFMPNMVEALTWAVTWKLPSPMKANTRCLPSRACW